MTSRLQLRRPALRRVSLRGMSVWVWVFIAVTLVWIGLSVVSVSTIDIQSIYAAFVAATPALFAAALMYAAPHERRIQVAAFCFAFPVIVNAVIGVGILIVSRLLSDSYNYLGERLVGWNDAFAVIGWIFPIIAIFLIASYIGTTLSRRGWLIVALGVVLFVVGAVLVASTLPAGVPLLSALAGLLKQTVWIAWAYLLAVAWPPRMYLLSFAGLSNLASAVLSLASFAFIQSQGGDTAGPITDALLPVLWLLGVISWATLIVGIVRELPRYEDEAPAERRPAHSAAGVMR